jgi:iron(III) transport system permease protein
MAMVVWGSVIGFWPYDLNFTWANYAFNATLYGLKPFGHSLILAFSVAGLGAGLIFGASYILTRWSPPGWLAGPYRLMALTPLVVPGTVLGLAYILAFNRPALDFFYSSMAIMVVNSIIHFYSVGHLAFCGSLALLDQRYEQVGGSLGAPPGRTFRRVIIPLQKHILLEVAFYFFINALTTVSAVIFIYSPATAPASVAILQMFDSGQIAEAAAMGTVILLISLAVRGLLVIFNKSSTPG